VVVSYTAAAVCGAKPSYAPLVSGSMRPNVTIRSPTSDRPKVVSENTCTFETENFQQEVYVSNLLEFPMTQRTEDVYVNLFNRQSRKTLTNKRRNAGLHSMRVSIESGNNA
jgi:hypothetical protein